MIAEWRLVGEVMIGEWMMTGKVIKVRLKWKADLDQIVPTQSFVTWKREALRVCAKRKGATHRQSDT